MVSKKLFEKSPSIELEEILRIANQACVSSFTYLAEYGGASCLKGTTSGFMELVTKYNYRTGLVQQPADQAAGSMTIVYKCQIDTPEGWERPDPAWENNLRVRCNLEEVRKEWVLKDCVIGNHFIGHWKVCFRVVKHRTTRAWDPVEICPAVFGLQHQKAS